MATLDRTFAPPSRSAVAVSLDAPTPVAAAGRRVTDRSDAEPTRTLPSTGCLTVVVDGFERFDGVGHAPTGLHVLDIVARRLQSTVRASDIVFRHKDAGFTVLLTATDDVRALDAAQRLRVAFDQAPISTEPPITVSIAAAIGAPERIIETVDRADAALAADAGSAGLVIVDDRLSDLG